MANDVQVSRELFLNNTPMLDTRAPVEFGKGAFPGAVNLPLMTDAEREAVGICYKQQGQEAAIALGHQLVSGATKAQRIAAWSEFARSNPDGVLYCFRGGLRSRISQQWLRSEAGIDYPRVTGGYKAMRGFLLHTIDDAVADCEFIVIGGMTGCGKTDALIQLQHGLDLEAHANHRGSSFGKRLGGQPSNIDFENRLAIDILKKRAAGNRQLVVEDESRLIGRCALPLPLYQGMQQFPMVWLEDTLDGRVDRILRDYVMRLGSDYRAMYPDNGFTLFSQHLLLALTNIQKRLGFQRHAQLTSILSAALAEQARSGSLALHREWISTLLREYYDPIYAHQRRIKEERIEFCGELAAVVAYLQARAGR